MAGTGTNPYLNIFIHRNTQETYEIDRYLLDQKDTADPSIQTQIIRKPPI